MKPGAGRCPGERRDPSTRCSCRRDMDPGVRRGSVQYSLLREPPCFLLAQQSNLMPVALGRSGLLRRSAPRNDPKESGAEGHHVAVSLGRVAFAGRSASLSSGEKVLEKGGYDGCHRKRIAGIVAADAMVAPRV